MLQAWLDIVVKVHNIWEKTVRNTFLFLSPVEGDLPRPSVLASRRDVWSKVLIFACQVFSVHSATHYLLANSMTNSVLWLATTASG